MNILEIYKLNIFSNILALLFRQMKVFSVPLSDNLNCIKSFFKEAKENSNICRFI